MKVTFLAVWSNSNAQIIYILKPLLEMTNDLLVFNKIKNSIFRNTLQGDFIILDNLR